MVTLNSAFINSVYDKLIENRIIFIKGEINETTASEIVAKLLYLDSLNNDDITIYINSPGGCVTCGLMIYDTINYIKSDVSTISIGLSASMAAIILMSGTKGKRKILPHGKVMLHEISTDTGGKLSDILLHTKEAEKANDILQNIIVQNSCLAKEDIEKKLTKDYYLDSSEALKFGVIDKIIT